MKNVVIVGGGASGLAAAIYAKKNGNDVTILERNNMACKKILLTGNGRCNYFNNDQSLKHYHSNDDNLIKNIITEENLKEVLSFFDELGIVPKIKNGYYYPYSNQALSIKQVLLSKIKELGINVIYNYLVTNVKKENNKFIINNDITCDVLILGTGSKAYPKTGSDGIGYKIAKNFNHNIIKVMPALVQLKSNNKYLKELKGIRCDAKVSIYEDNKFLNSEEGELQLTDYGISGICVFNLSYLAIKSLSNNKKVHVYVNFIPFIKTKEALMKYLDDRGEKLKNKKMDEFFDGLLNYKLANTLLKKSNINTYSYYKDLSIKDKEYLISNINEYDFKIMSSNSFDSAQVCQGGISLSEVNLSTMESKKKENLYIIGELLDINGDCGGYNLTFAFISGMKAGMNIK